MKKAKLFMMLALLVMGVSNTMGATKTKDFFVNYEKQFLNDVGGVSAGYSFDASKSTRITKIEEFGNISSLGTTNVGDRMIRVTYIEYSEGGYYSSGDYPDDLNPNDIDDARIGYVNYDLARELMNCITANDLPNYTETVWMSRNRKNIAYTNGRPSPYYSYSGGNTVYITYQYTGSDYDTWDGKDGFTYSTLYTKTNSTNVKNKIKLPDGQCAISLNDYTKTSVTIPKIDPKNKNKVVALQTLAMCQNGVKHRIDYRNCNITDDGEVGSTAFNSADPQYANDDNYGMINWSSNGTLQEVIFDKPSNVISIGDYAFESCHALTTIELPKSLKYLGEGCFSQCLGITDGLTFERTSGASFTTDLEVIRNFTFWNCQNMTDLELPDGIIVIEGQQSGSSMQYLMDLTKLRLPNTVVAIGPHFLCDASSLTTVTIPASVKYIDGACFHGCENLSEVYLMGPASALQGVYDGSDTFGSNMTNCKSHVSQCVFITTQENIKGYVEDPNKVWQLIADNKDGKCSTDLYAVAVNDKGQAVRDDDGNFVYEKDKNNENKTLTYKDGTTVAVPSTTSWGQTIASPCSKGWNNALTFFPDQKVQYTPGKWVTVILPKKYTRTELETKFGSDVMLAEMTGFKDGQPFSYVNGLRTYHLKFTEVKDDPEAHKPYMIKPGHIVKDKTAADYNSPYWVTLIACTEMGEDYRNEVPKDHALPIKCTEDQTEVVMYGRYQAYDMLQWEFYFMNPKDENDNYNNKCVFKRIVDPNEAPTIKPFRCYWRIWLKGEAQNAGAGAKTAYFRFADDNETTGIEQVDSKINIEISGIYDMNGRKLDVKKEDLPKGIFIIDGKKVMVK